MDVNCNLINFCKRPKLIQLAEMGQIIFLKVFRYPKIPFMVILREIPLGSTHIKKRLKFGHCPEGGGGVPGLPKLLGWGVMGGGGGVYCTIDHGSCTEYALLFSLD